MCFMFIGQLASSKNRIICIPSGLFKRFLHLGVDSYFIYDQKIFQLMDKLKLFFLNFMKLLTNNLCRPAKPRFFKK